MSPPRAATPPPANEPWWLRPTSPRAALGSLALCLALASLAGWLAARQSPLAVRSLLPLGGTGAREVYLSTLLDDPQRMALTTQRDATTADRGDAALGGNRYWVHRYGDPERPELPERILLTSRRRGARLLVPVAAIDLDSALSTPVGVGPAEKGGGGFVPRDLVQLYVDRQYRGAYLELRFPDRAQDAKGDPLRFDLVAVRGNQARTSDFVLLPNPRYYRTALIEGSMPGGEYVASALPDGPELAFAFYEDPERPIASLQLPISLFHELGLAWGDEVPTLVDDRWQLDALPRYATTPAPAELREQAARMLALQLAARLDPAPERERLARAVGAWLEQ